jgi:hypothetical protein
MDTGFVEERWQKFLNGSTVSEPSNDIRSLGGWLQILFVAPDKRGHRPFEVMFYFSGYPVAANYFCCEASCKSRRNPQGRTASRILGIE